MHWLLLLVTNVYTSYQDMRRNEKFSQNVNWSTKCGAYFYCLSNEYQNFASYIAFEFTLEYFIEVDVFCGKYFQKNGLVLFYESILNQMLKSELFILTRILY